LTAENLQKAEISEQIIKDYFRSLNYIVYGIEPVDKGKRHFFDFVCTLNKEDIIYVDVKFKQNSIFKKKVFGELHGINVTSFEEYQQCKKISSCKFFLIFVELLSKTVYFQEIDKLQNPVYTDNNKIICWKVSEMKILFHLDDNHIERLKNPNNVEV
jgi:hypothetical protein